MEIPTHKTVLWRVGSILPRLPKCCAAEPEVYLIFLLFLPLRARILIYMVLNLPLDVSCNVKVVFLHSSPYSVSQVSLLSLAYLQVLLGKLHPDSSLTDSNSSYMGAISPSSSPWSKK